MKREVFLKENGVTTKLTGNEQVEELDEIFNATPTTVHKCSTCQYCRADMCEKVRDRAKHKIKFYGFIKGGYQIYKNGNLKNFVVADCENFKLDKPRDTIRNSREKIAKLNALKELFTGATNLAEANQMIDKNHRLYRKYKGYAKEQTEE